MTDDLKSQLRARAAQHIAATPVSLLEKAATRIEELEEDLSRTRREVGRLREALSLADWALSGANINMVALEKKVRQALETVRETHSGNSKE